LQKELWQQSVPPALNQASVGLGIYVINWFVGKFGAQAIAAYGVAVRLEQLVLLPALGLSLAMLPLAAQNDGAGHFDRAVEARKLAQRWGIKISIAAFIILVFGGRFLMSLVTPDPEVQAEGALFLKFDATIFFSYVALYVNVAFLQGLKRPMFAIWIGLYRQIAAPILVFWLLAFTLGLGTIGIWLGIALVTASGAVIAEVYTRRVVRQKLASGEF
jgi:Na+-driven multidrug efflux pump